MSEKIYSTNRLNLQNRFRWLPYFIEPEQYYNIKKIITCSTQHPCIQQCKSSVWPSSLLTHCDLYLKALATIWVRLKQANTHSGIGNKDARIDAMSTFCNHLHLTFADNHWSHICVHACIFAHHATQCNSSSTCCFEKNPHLQFFTQVYKHLRDHALDRHTRNNIGGMHKKKSLVTHVQQEHPECHCFQIRLQDLRAQEADFGTDSGTCCWLSQSTVYLVTTILTVWPALLLMYSLIRSCAEINDASVVVALSVRSEVSRLWLFGSSTDWACITEAARAVGFPATAACRLEYLSTIFAMACTLLGKSVCMPCGGRVWRFLSWNYDWR